MESNVRKAIKEIVWLLLEQDQRWNEYLVQLEEVDLNSSAYEVLKRMTGNYEVLLEHMDLIQQFESHSKSETALNDLVTIVMKHYSLKNS
ncbi:hypothetical protein M3225_10875 [Priestia aryabhattai]|uniref:hypothetical protein n=1 Tax=Priestia aryabhattai TaxID=412384 RepID=UPI00203EA5EC|nr:hypothetical protein [Priestia aryabhattai]MCM3770995.1 hypothetical protein [Priestia aryabhattai]